MGWTHNWQRASALPLEEFAAAARDSQRIARALPVGLAGPDGTGEPIFTEDGIGFNGSQPASCEAFRIGQVEHDRQGRDTVWSFCKTQGLPYDLLVQCVLIILDHHLGEAISVGSDGTDDDWARARAIVSEHLRYGAEFRLAIQS